MGFPDDDLEVTADFAFGADTTTDPSTWAWTDLTSRLVATPITVDRGVLVGAGSHRSAKTSITLLNDDGALTPLLATSPYWPYVDVGTPARLRIRSNTTAWVADTFTRTQSPGWGPADSGQTWGANSGFAVTGSTGTVSFTATNQLRSTRVGYQHRDVWARWDQSIAAVSTGAPHVVGCTLRGAADSGAADAIWAGLEFGVSGTLKWTIRTIIGGSFTIIPAQVSETFTYTAGSPIRCEVELIGDTLRARAWPAAGSPPDGWTVSVQLTVLTGTVVGNFLGMAFWCLGGNTNTLPDVISIDNLTFGQPRYPRMEGFLTDVRPSFQPLSDGTVHSVVQVDIGGIGSRSEKPDAASWSPLRRSLQQSVSPPKAYWPCEDAEGAVSAASAFPGGTPMLVTGPAVFDLDTGESEEQKLRTYGTQNFCSLAAGASLVGGVNPAVGSSAWTVSAAIAEWTPGIGGGVTEVRLMEWATPGGDFNRWALVRTLTGHTVRAYNDGAGTSTDVLSYANGFNVFIGYDVTATQSGGSINVAFWANAVQFATGTVSGTLAAVSRVKINPDRVNTTASVDPFGIRFIVGHVMVHDSALTAGYPYYFDNGTLLNAGTAWAYEYAHRRFSRLCAEERVPYRVVGTPYTTGTTQLGPQQPGTFTELVAASVEAESGGLITEERFGYTHVPRTARYNAPVALTVNMATYRRSDGTDPTDVLVPKLDARGPNFWTVKRTNGSEATAAAPLVYRNRRGTITDSATLDVLTDADTVHHAGWRVHLYADGGQANYPQLSLELAANPGLVADYLTVVVGSRVQRTNQPTIAGIGTIDQVVDQMSETFTPRSAGGPSWTATLDTSPAGVWDVAVFDTSRFDSASTTLGSSVTSSVSSWLVKTVNPVEVWDTAAVPYDWLVDGEQVTVTAITSASLSGGAYQQTATVTRAVNGVSRSHTAGVEVHLANPAYLAL